MTAQITYNFDPIPAHEIITQLDSDEIILVGSEGSGKTVSMAKILLYYIITMEAPYKALMMFKQQGQLRNTILGTIEEEIQKQFGNEWTKYWKINRTDLVITYLPNGNKIYFRGSKDPEMVKGMGGMTGIQLIGFEEFTNFTKHDVQTIKTRIRSSNPNHRLFMIAAMNPVHNQFIMDEYFTHINEDELIKKKRIDIVKKIWDEKLQQHTQWKTTIIHTTFQDNPHLIPKNRAKILAYTDPKDIAIYREGRFYTPSGTILWDQCTTKQKVDQNLQHYDYIQLGIDYAITGTMAAILIGIKEPKTKNDTRQIYILKELYLDVETLIYKEMIQQLQKAFPNLHNIPITAESAGTGNITKELQALGYNVTPIKKTKFLKDKGITYLQNSKIIIWNNCKNTINELKNYTWKLDPTTNKPTQPPTPDPKKADHAIDAIRYACNIPIRKQYTQRTSEWANPYGIYQQ